MNEYDKALIDLVFLIRHKPQGYLGENSISKFRCFLDGFSFGYDYPHFKPFFPDFQYYIEKKYNLDVNNSWNNILLEYTGHDEEKALCLFFEEFEAFLEIENIEYEK